MEHINKLKQWEVECQKEGVDPLFPALARHIGHRSSDKDKMLLTKATQNPESYQEKDEKLFWGLKYFVRGDLILDDGSEITLDDFAEKVGLPPLPYLEEQPTPIELGDLEEE